MTEMQQFEEMAELSHKISDLFKRLKTEPVKAQAAMAYLIGVSMALDNQDVDRINDLVPIIRTSYMLAKNDMNNNKPGDKK